MSKNFIYKINVFFLIVIVFSSYSLSNNTFGNEIGSPYIQNITLRKYGFENNNYSIVQDTSGVLYIGNSNGILQFDGNFWNLIKTKGIPQLTITKKNIVFAGGFNEFGYLEYNTDKSLYFHNLVNPSDIRFGQVKKIFNYNNKIFFCTDKKLFEWNNKKLSCIDSSYTSINLFKVNNSIYYYKSEIGILKYINNTFSIIPNGKYFINKDIKGIFPLNKQVLIWSNYDNIFYLYDSYSVSRLKSKVNNYIKNNIYTSGCILENEDIAIGTKNGGIIILDKNGAIKNIISQRSGLTDIKINYLFVDNSGNLWALHNNSISRIETNSAFTFFNKNYGIEGIINNIIRFNNQLYIATSKGVYILDNTESNSKPFNKIYFNKLLGLNNEAYKFYPYKNSLFVSTPSGIYRIFKNNCLLFFNRKNKQINTSINSNYHNSLIYIGGKDGISAIKYVNGILIILDKIKGIPYEISEISEEKNGTIWANSKHNGIFRILPFKKYSSNLIFEHYSTKDITNNDNAIKFIKVQGNIIFSSLGGIYKFDKTTKTFKRDTILESNFTDKFDTWIFPIIEDINHNLWVNILSQNKIKKEAYILHYDLDSNNSFNYIPLKKLKKISISCIYPDTNNIIWFGGNEELIMLNTKLQRSTYYKFSTLIHSITIGKDSVILNNTYPSSINKISNTVLSKFAYNNNTIQFSFTATNFESEKEILYQTKLVNFDKKWSAWTSSNYKEYTNLHEGNYIFQVRSKDIFENTSNNIAEYKFHILPPFYRTTIAYIAYIILFILLIIVIFKWREYYFAREKFKLENIISERTEEIVLQKEKADNLLERVLPKNTAQILKSGEKAEPYHYKMVTVLFSDIQGFTKISEQLDSEHLIDELDTFFLKFDSVVEKHNIEKIKTIGDAYMCAGGIPEKNRTNPVEVILAAFEMQNYMKSLKHETGIGKKKIWDLRIGIDTGPVVSGVLGRNKITYDIWGGTVNTASRMESSSEPGKINITETTYLLIKDFFICKYRGKMPVKHKGEIDMYFVESFKPELASDIKGLYPNENFFIQLQLLRFNDLEEYILNKLETGLPNNLFYHDVKHTIDVVTQVELIGRSEKVSDSELLLLKTAALFHDLGHLINYDSHEEEGVKLAKKILPEYKYSKSQINEIAKLILVTKMPPIPQNLLEEIMCDADLDYLGRPDFIPVSGNLFKELSSRNKIDSISEWNKHQSNFIQKHQYFTETARKLREVNKNIQLKKIEIEINKEIAKTDD